MHSPDRPAPDPASGRPSVTVLVCTRDRPDALRRCLSSVLSGQDRPDELLVVDQGRDDRGGQVVRDLADRALRHLPDPRSGLSAAQNLGFAEAVGDVVLVTDDDCVVAPEWVGTVRAAFAADPGLGLLGGRVLPLGDAAPDLLPVSSRTGAEARRLNARSAPWDLGSGNNFALRAEVARAVQGNDERLGPGAPLRGGGDMDLFRRVLRTGAGGRYEPAATVLHERATAAQRLERRIPYGLGTGAGLVLWWRQGDRGAPALLRAWLRLRLHLLRGGLRRREPRVVREELLMLVGTARGLVAGWSGLAGPVSALPPSGGPAHLGPGA